MMTCSVAFSNKDLDLSFFVFKPTVVIIDHVVHALKQFSLQSENLGCVQSSIFRSIHGNMIIWCGAWQKRSSDEKDKLTAKLKSMLTNVTRMAVLVEHSFLDAYAGESRDGSSSSTVKLCNGDIISINSGVTTAKDLDDLCYAVLAIFRSGFAKIEGITAGLCLKGQSTPSVVCIHMWKSLQFCYSWAINHRKWMIPYLERFSIIDMKYDIFRVVYVSGDNVNNLAYISPHKMLENEEESRQGEVMQN